eukprot:4929256-Pleurochrysis_carterae.AAC.1
MLPAAAQEDSSSSLASKLSTLLHGALLRRVVRKNPSLWALDGGWKSCLGRTAHLPTSPCRHRYAQREMCRLRQFTQIFNLNAFKCTHKVLGLHSFGRKSQVVNSRALHGICSPYCTSASQS